MISKRRFGGSRSGAHTGEAGQALVELALVIPLLLVLVIGIFEFGRAWNAYQVITDAAREGARNAVVLRPSNPHATPQELEALRQTVLSTVNDALAHASLDPNNAVITVVGHDTGRGQPTTVTIAYPYEFVFLGPLLGWVSGQSSITLGTSFVMRNE